MDLLVLKKKVSFSLLPTIEKLFRFLLFKSNFINLSNTYIFLKNKKNSQTKRMN